MKLSYLWLSEYVNLDGVTPVLLAEKLTNVGLAVDGLVSRNAGVQGVVVGLVETCVQHPNADRLKVCTVNVGESDLLTIVCGANNVAAGLKVPVAVPGAQLPSMNIQKTKLRGIESNGMLCSAKELGLEVRLLPVAQTEGLFLLPSDAPLGADIVSVLHLNDVILEVDLTPNRSDCMSMRGLAYEVAAILDRPVKFPEVTIQSEKASPAVTVRIETDRCTRYAAQVVEGLKSGPSPLWMQMRLLSMGVRPIGLTVDITNYVMLEWGQPLHAFDLDKVTSQTIVVRQAHADEEIVTLDGLTRKLNEDMTVIADPKRAIGIAGVMGGENSEITGATSRTIIESATFHAAGTRRTGQKLGLRSEAQQRFEKGIDPVAVIGALERATTLLESLAGATRVGCTVDVMSHAAFGVPRRVSFLPQRCNARLGTTISDEDMLSIFTRLGFEVDPLSTTEWHVIVPTRRQDIAIEEDLVEEVGRLYGFDAIPSTLPFGPTTVGARTPFQRMRKRTREVLIGAGMSEVFTYAFSHPDRLKPLRLPPSSPLLNMIPLARPMSDERTALRTTILPSLVEVALHNLAHGVTGGQIFELAPVYWPHALPLNEQPNERTLLCALWFGETEFGFAEKPRNFDFYDVKGIVETWLQAEGLLRDAHFKASDVSWLHPGRSVYVQLSGKTVGWFGELHPETASDYGLSRALALEFDMQAVLDNHRSPLRVTRLPKYPVLRRDLAVVVADGVEVGALLTLAERVASDLSQPSILESCRVFDVYVGKGIPDGHKSVAVSFWYRAEDRTLTDDEVNQLEQKILTVWNTAFSAVLRS